jgi:hypothetical protein
MTIATTRQALAATRQWLKPVIYILLKCGVTWREFSELSKSVYVEVASSRFGKRGRPTNVSRTAVLTGLARRDVRKQRESLQTADTALTGYVTKASLVLSAWHLDEEFMTPAGNPRLLPLEGDRGSFSSLLRRCGAGDIRQTTLLKELVNAGAVRQRTDGRLQVLMRNFIPHGMDATLVRLWGTVMADVAETYAHNLTRSPKEAARFERSAVNDRIEKTSLPEFRAFLATEAQAFLERVDEWLTAHQADDATPESDSVAIRMGAGVYQIED